MLAVILAGCSTEKSETENNPKTSNQDTSVETLLTAISENLRSSVVAFYPFVNGSLKDFSGNNQHLTNTTAYSHCF